MTTAPVYEVCPESVTVTVYCTTDPGVVAGTFAVLTIVSPGITTLTVDVQRGSALPAGQLLPGAVVAPVRVMTCPPAG